QHQRLGLRVLAHKKPRKLLRISLLERFDLERFGFVRSLEPVYRAACAAVSECFRQQARGDILAAYRDEFLRRHHLLVFLQDQQTGLERNLSKVQHFLGNSLEIFFGHVPQNLRAGIFSQDGEEDRGFAWSRQLGALNLHYDGSSRSHACSARAVCSGFCFINSKASSLSRAARIASSPFSTGGAERAMFCTDGSAF